jgi:hypothetical protein
MWRQGARCQTPNPVPGVQPHFVDEQRVGNFRLVTLSISKLEIDNARCRRHRTQIQNHKMAVSTDDAGLENPRRDS